MPNTPPVEVFIIARPVVKRLTDPADQDVAGRYRVALKPGIPDAHLASAALDVFHSDVPVDTLDDFSFEVTDLGGKALAQDDTAKQYQYVDCGEIVGVEALPSNQGKPSGPEM